MRRTTQHTMTDRFLGIRRGITATGLGLLRRCLFLAIQLRQCVFETRHSFEPGLNCHVMSWQLVPVAVASRSSGSSRQGRSDVCGIEWACSTLRYGANASNR
ncbi:MAG: hypothetical protein CMJ80_00945 [Planctomycetaceae bacterium]|jgi:hypothetical protein|nr:hypothetical protein [Planctomycetaceae bacterium]